MTEPNISPEDVTTPPGESGLTSDPPGSVGDRIEPIGANLEQSGDVDGDREPPSDEPGRMAEDLPAANQQKTEPVPPSPPQGESFVSDPDTSGQMPVEPPHGLADPTGRATPPDTVTPADAGGLSASGQARPAVAPAGKPDGEVDTRPL